MWNVVKEKKDSNNNEKFGQRRKYKCKLRDKLNKITTMLQNTKRATKTQQTKAKGTSIE